ncbi:hypothetical protein BH09ACT10_BH09ACT10_23700 [soil metagenome]
MTDPLAKSVERVVRRGNCSGCGGCTLTSERIEMTMSSAGFLRPTVSPLKDGLARQSSRRQAAEFKTMCPGVRVSAPSPLGASDSIFGPHISVWHGWAVDPAMRFEGSSGGVLTALTTWLIQTGQIEYSVAAAQGSPAANTTTAVRITSKEEALAAAGSRYGPVSNLCEYDPGTSRSALVGKPCEISAAAQLEDSRSISAEARPIKLSFFCAGTPSQNATNTLSESLGIPADQATSLRYRGAGWPGDFSVSDASGKRASVSYDESWGKHLGHALQWRCKICVDGTGGHADVSVGDYWKSDDAGYPIFDNEDGRSVVIARTARGDSLLRLASTAGVLHLEPLDLGLVLPVQPLQVDRRMTLAYRLLGRAVVGKLPPHYRGFKLLRLAVPAYRRGPRVSLGTIIRSLEQDGQ